MKAIGGYFELELASGKEYHPKAIRLNSGRNAFEFILSNNTYKRIFLPYYTCDVLLQPLNKLCIPYEFYSINENFEPIFDFETLQSTDAFLYTNYFGLKSSFVKFLTTKKINLIVDSAQAFYAQPCPNVASFYSARKFFGVPDGAYVYGIDQNSELEQDFSFERFSHLLKRIDLSAEMGYADYVHNEEQFDTGTIKVMSKLSQKILDSINYKEKAQIRVENFRFLHKHLGSMNLLPIQINDDTVPMAYPFLSDDIALRQKLVQHKIYTPIFWQGMLKYLSKDDWEYQLVNKLVVLPIDQRVTTNDLEKIVNIISNEYTR